MVSISRRNQRSIFVASWTASTLVPCAAARARSRSDRPGRSRQSSRSASSRPDRSGACRAPASEEPSRRPAGRCGRSPSPRRPTSCGWRASGRRRETSRSESRPLHDHVVDRRLKACRRDPGDVVVISSRRYPTASRAAIFAIGKPVALDASAEERDTRGFISITRSHPSRDSQRLHVGPAGLDADRADHRDSLVRSC